MCYGNLGRVTLRAVKLIRPSGLTLLAGTLLLLMPALAVLQFRWVGQVSDAERERMRRNVEVAAGQFGEAFDREVRGASRDLQVSALSVRDSAWDRYASRFDEWSRDTAHPAMVKSVYLIDAPGGQLGVRRWDTANRTFQTVEWPQALEPWRQDFEEELKDFLFSRTPEGTRRFTGQDSLLLRPVGFIQAPRPERMNPSTGSRQTTAQQVYGFTVVELNLPYIRDFLLPELTHRHFAVPITGETYRVAVVEGNAPKQVVYKSVQEAPTDPNQVDAVQGLFILGQRGGPSRDPRAAPERRGLGSAERDAVRPPTLDELPGRWRLLVQHERAARSKPPSRAHGGGTSASVSAY